MTFEIDTGTQDAHRYSMAGPTDGKIDYSRRPEHAERKHRQIKEAIASCETAEEVDDLLNAESYVIDALFLNFPHYAEAVEEAATEWKAMLAGSSGASVAPAEQVQTQVPNSPSGNTAKKGNTMNAFSNFDQGSSGSEGPWLAWSARGAQDGSVPPKSFYLRDTAGREPFDMSKGIILDLDTAKTGWCYSSGVAGQAPIWKWNPSISKFEQRPDEDYKKGFQMRVAIGGGKTATWEDSGAGAWNAFAALAGQLAQGPEGKLPMVRMTGAKDEKFARGSTSTALLEVVQWVDRPDCLKEGVAAGIDTGDGPAPQPTQTKAQAEATAGEEVEF